MRKQIESRLRWNTPAECCRYLPRLRKRHTRQLGCRFPTLWPNPPQIPIYHPCASWAWPTPLRLTRWRRPHPLHVELPAWRWPRSLRTQAGSAFQTAVSEGGIRPSTAHTAAESFQPSLMPSQCNRWGSCKFQAESRQLLVRTVLQISAAECVKESQHYIQYNTHTHVYGPLSRTTRLSRYQKGITNLDFTEARDSEWQWHQLDHMQVCTTLQTDNHASTPPLCFLQAGCLSYHPANSVKELKEIQYNAI